MKQIEYIRENAATMTEAELQEEIENRTDAIWMLKMADNYNGAKVASYQRELFEITNILEGRK